MCFDDELEAFRGYAEAIRGLTYDPTFAIRGLVMDRHTGIPLLFQTAYSYGLVKHRAVVKLVGGAEMPQTTKDWFNTGHRNLLAARNLLWRNGVFVAAEDVGGTDARTVHMAVGSGRLHVFSGRSHKEL